MDEAVGVGGLDPSGDVLPDAQHLVEGAALREPALQVAAGDQFGDQFDGALRVEHLVDPDQVGWFRRCWAAAARRIRSCTAGSRLYTTFRAWSVLRSRWTARQVMASGPSPRQAPTR